MQRGVTHSDFREPALHLGESGQWHLLFRKAKCFTAGPSGEGWQYGISDISKETDSPNGKKEMGASAGAIPLIRVFSGENGLFLSVYPLHSGIATALLAGTAVFSRGNWRFTTTAGGRP